MSSRSNSEYYEMMLCVGATDGNLRAARELYRQRFIDGRPVAERRLLPSMACFSRMVQRLYSRGSFHEPASEGRPSRSDPEFEDAVLEYFESTPRSSTRRAALVLGAENHVKVWRVLRQDRQHPYHFRPIQELTPGDFLPRVTFCEWYLRQTDASPSFISTVLWTDEASFTRAGINNLHNEHVWAHTNPHASSQSSFQHQWRLNVWAGIIGKVLVGPVFFPQILNGPNYLEFLRNRLDDALDVLPVARYVDLVMDNNMIFQHDGAPAHYAREVRNYLDARFPQWIGRGSTSVAWPPRSPDLTPLDFFLWGYIKNTVYAVECDTVLEMKVRIKNAFRSVTPDMLRNVQRNLRERAALCVQRQGQHIEPHLH